MGAARLLQNQSDREAVIRRWALQRRGAEDIEKTVTASSKRDPEARPTPSVMGGGVIGSIGVSASRRCRVFSALPTDSRRGEASAEIGYTENIQGRSV